MPVVSNTALVHRVRGAAEKLRLYYERNGLRAMLLAIVRALFEPVVRYRWHFIWQSALAAPSFPSPWADDEHLTIIGPENFAREMNPQLLRFLGGARAADDLEGVRKGDRLLIVTVNGRYVYSGYIYFDTTSETRRQMKIYAERPGVPVIGTCVSTPVKIWDGSAAGIAQSATLSSYVQRLLPDAMNLRDAASGFKNLAQFIYTVRLSHNLDIPFDRLKVKMAGGGQSLWDAVHELRPDVDAMREVRRVWDEVSIHRRVLNDVFRYLRGLGYDRAINDVVAHNDSSSKANVAVGMTICRELRDWTVFRRLVVQRVFEANRRYWRFFVA